jgi:hypothetical protein
MREEGEVRREELGGRSEEWKTGGLRVKFRSFRWG